LDKPSEGLIFLTNDGDIVNKILRARNNHEKEYIVSVNRPINRDFIQRMSNGVKILNTITKNCFVEKFNKDEFFYDYGKKSIKDKRKMGHLTVLKK